MGGGGGSYKSVYKERELTPEERRSIELDNITRESSQLRADEARAAQEAADAAKLSSYTEGLNPYYETLLSQLERGVIDENTATANLQGYIAEAGIDERPNALFTGLTNTATELAGSRALNITNQAYQTLLGRAPTPEELEIETANLTGGIENYTYDSLKSKIIDSDEYQKKYNDSYLDNYYDSYFGEQERDEEGNLTGKRTFDFSTEFMPAYEGALDVDTGITMPTFGSFTGDPAELEEYQQSIRQARSFMYNAGLTNLQGNIDKELTKMKNESAERQKRISGEFGIAQSAISNFFAT
jgi:hypothetical protein